MLGQFEPSKITVVYRDFRLLKNTVVVYNFGPSRINVWDRIFIPFKNYNNNKNCGEGGGQYNCGTTCSCIIRPYYQAEGRTQYK